MTLIGGFLAYTEIHIRMNILRLDYRASINILTSTVTYDTTPVINLSNNITAISFLNSKWSKISCGITMTSKNMIIVQPVQYSVFHQQSHSLTFIRLTQLKIFINVTLMQSCTSLLIGLTFGHSWSLAGSSSWRGWWRGSIETRANRDAASFEVTRKSSQILTSASGNAHDKRRGLVTVLDAASLLAPISTEPRHHPRQEVRLPNFRCN